ncbi:OmpA family protein [Ferruginibacter albus]|uniref:OmpA family protein n=1 Tax=Ferruginibacter albus TaxID=2875540 RepID=UPI001CC41278|nr:OmpA family protein [Ferruginibacter albus]UAY52536.1 OmpA family protein [Ferruginibacter albus]
MNRYLLTLILFCCCYSLTAQTKASFKYIVYFPSDSFTVTEQSKEAFEAILNTYRQTGKIDSIAITGYTDATGNDAYNIELSKKRATDVVNWLTFFQAENNSAFSITAKWLGKADPVESNNTIQGKMMNRRAEISVYASPALLTIKQLFEATKLNPDRFCISNDRDTILVAKHGTLIYIKANSIQLPEGYGCAPCITVEVKEALYKDDIVAENLTTVSGDNILVSQSMVNVQFKCGDNLLQLKQGSNYVIMSPTDAPNNGNKIYKGDWDSTLGHFDWKGTDSTSQTILPIPADLFKKCGGWQDKVIYVDDCSHCSLVFCGIGKWMSGWFSDVKRQSARDYFSCRRNKRQTAAATKRAIAAGFANQSQALQDSIRSLYQKAQNDMPEIRLPSDSAIAKAPCNALLELLKKEYAIKDSLFKEKYLEMSLMRMQQNGNPINYRDINQLQYNVYAVSQTGWSNIDWMTKVPEDKLKTIYVNLAPSDYTDCKLVFKNRRTIIPASRKLKDQFVFPFIPVDEEAYLLIINTNAPKGKVQVQILDITTGAQTITPQLETIPLEKFLAYLKTLNK